MGDTGETLQGRWESYYFGSKIKKPLYMQRNNGILFCFFSNTNKDCAWMKISNKQSRASIQRSSCSPHTCGSQSRCAGDSDTLPAAEPPPASSLPKWQCMVWRTAVHLDTRSPANGATWSSNYWKCMGSALNSCTPWHSFTVNGTTWSSNYW